MGRQAGLGDAGVGGCRRSALRKWVFASLANSAVRRLFLEGCSVCLCRSGGLHVGDTYAPTVRQLGLLLSAFCNLAAQHRGHVQQFLNRRLLIISSLHSSILCIPGGRHDSFVKGCRPCGDRRGGYGFRLRALGMIQFALPVRHFLIATMWTLRKSQINSATFGQPAPSPTSPACM